MSGPMSEEQLTTEYNNRLERMLQALLYKAGASINIPPLPILRQMWSVIRNYGNVGCNYYELQASFRDEDTGGRLTIETRVQYAAILESIGAITIDNDRMVALPLLDQNNKDTDVPTDIPYYTSMLEKNGAININKPFLMPILNKNKNNQKNK